MPDLASKVAAAMTRRSPAWADVPGVVAVSGGADSVALLRALHQTNPPGGLVVAHLNHQLRGDESDADADFVRELADRLCKSFHVEAFTVKQLGGNLEATARAVRYEWLAKVAVDTGAGWIATGHTADDQAETVLHRLIRGTGVTGLRGIASFRFVPPSPGGRGVRGEGFVSSLVPPSPGGEGNQQNPNPRFSARSCPSLARNFWLTSPTSASRSGRIRRIPTSLSPVTGFAPSCSRCCGRSTRPSWTYSAGSRCKPKNSRSGSRATRQNSCPTRNSRVPAARSF